MCEFTKAAYKKGHEEYLEPWETLNIYQLYFCF